MRDEPTGEFFDTEKYQIPQQDWVCGHHSDGDPCPIGPNGSGECLVAKICVPVHDGAAWHCTRARVWGGRCKDGPVPDPECPDQQAICPHQPAPCQPDRNLRNKRRLVTGVTAAAALGCCLVILGSSSGDPDSVMGASTAIISPGPLSAHHATMNQGCAACHSAALESPLDLLNCAFGGHDGIQESKRCLECHKNFGDHAMFPHSLDPADLAVETERLKRKISDEPRTTQQRLTRMLASDTTAESGKLACSICHQEHRGAAHDLTHLTNSQCQSCHTSTFHSFADGHSEFPDRKRAFIYFDHFTHLQTHFPKHGNSGDQPSQTLKCGDCHVQDATGTSMILSRFENICAKCHAGQIADDHMPIGLRMPGMAFFELPRAETPNDTSRDQSLPPFMEIMLLSDDEAQAAIKTLRNSETATSTASAAQKVYASSIKRLINDLVTDRERAVTERLLSAATDDQPTGELAKVVAGRLSESGFFAALQVAQAKSSPDQQDSDEDASATEAGPDALSLMGAWAISDGLTLRYRSRGHADPLLRDWLSFAAAAASQYPDPPNGDSTGAFDRLFQRLAAPEATGHCMKCHTVDDLQGEQRRINWSSRQVMPTASEFTKFAHGPHVTLLSSVRQAQGMGNSTDTRCETCHGLQDREPVLRKSDFVLDDWMPNPDFTHPSTIGLNSVNRESCAACHTPKLAGDNCLQCHSYHVHPSTRHGR